MSAIPTVSGKRPLVYQVRLLEGERSYEQWDTYVHAAKSATHYHLSGWKKLIEELFGHETFYFYSADRDGGINGILPIVRLKSRLFGDYAVSMPYFNYGGVVAESPEIEYRLLDKACKTVKTLGAGHIEFRHTREYEDSWLVRRDKVSMILDLPDREESLWKALGSKVRSQIKRPQREDPKVLLGGLELLDDFYRVFTINMRDLGTPVYSKAFFKRILQTYPESGRIITVSLRGKPVGAGFLLGYRDMLEIPWASTLREVNPLSINMLLYWEVLRHAIDKGYKRFDFGRCTRGSGTYRFKKQWGADEKQLYWHYWLRDGAKLPGLTPGNPKFKLAISIWRNLPVWVANLLGPSIVKNLP
ncbi:MAG TPA: FemAB family XrtA/PEP-CTERM system-associated protein [Gammaproteobacteria bacterium]|jgi:FemAB-related protein (PEP-CTERM system-associated)